MNSIESGLSQRLSFHDFQAHEAQLVRQQEALENKQAHTHTVPLIEKLPDPKKAFGNAVIIAANAFTSNVPTFLATGAGYGIGSEIGGLDGPKTAAVAGTVFLYNQYTTIINTRLSAGLVEKGRCNNAWQIATHLVTKKVFPEKKVLQKRVTWLVGGVGISAFFEALYIKGLITIRPEDALPAFISKEAVSALGGTVWIGINSLLGRGDKKKEKVPEPRSLFDLYTRRSVKRT